MRSSETFYPLSPLQEGLLFLGLATPGSTAYVNQFICRLSGGIDVETYEQAWQSVMERHPILRTRFLWTELKRPVQLVKNECSLPFKYLDFTSLSPTEQRTRVEAVFEDERKRGFDFSEPPLMRIALMRTGEECYELVWSFHHILLDGWSMFLVLDDAFALYDTLRAGKTPELSNVRPFRDHIAWLHRRDGTSAEGFWRKSLEGLEGRTPLVVERSAEIEPSSGDDSATRGIQLPPESMEKMLATCKAAGLTLNTLVQGAWALLLSRYSGESDIVFGSVMSGRHAELAGAESMIGLFINTLPLRIQVPSQAKILPWLRRLQDVQVGIGQFDYCSLADVQQWSPLKGGESLFDSIYLFENYPKEVPIEEMGENLQVSDIRWFERTHYSLVALAVPEDCELRLIYHRSRFQDSTIDRILGHWQSLIEGITARPDTRLCDLQLLTQPEQQQLRVEFNATRATYPEDHTVHALFEKMAGERPDAVALVFEQEQVSYGQLNARANQFARKLHQLGTKPEDLVGLCIERSVEMIVALLGILKAGGAYVPLDPSHPPDRLAYMLSNSGCTVLVTESRLESLIPRERDVSTFCMDTERETLEAQSSRPLTGQVHPDSLAYVIYTSGSTGKPKGVQVQHRGVVNFLESMRREPGLKESDVLLSVTTLSFDISVLELILPLSVGARVVLASRETSVDASRLETVLHQSAASVVQATPATWRMLIESGWKGDTGLKVLCGGEALPRDLATQLLERTASLWNMYGPTETTIWSTVARVLPDPEPITIGQPIANTQIYILDSSFQLAPVNVAGELCIGGDGLARGYLNQPALTAEKFCPDSFGSAPGGRIYRAGDVARWSQDGVLECLGRVDNQVKVRGFRIELGDIESVLCTHPDVLQAVAAVREDTPHDKRLVAYLVEGEAADLSETELRTHLRRELPEYMIPATFMKIPSVPLTPNGKVDRRALPAPNGGTRLEEGYVAPRDELELQLSAIWQEVLGLVQVGVHDSFFDLGGHSLLAVRLFAKIQEHLGSRLPLATLFEANTVSQLAEIMRTGEGGATWSALVPIQRGDGRPPFFCIHAEGGEVLFYADLARLLGPEQAVYGLQARGLDGKQKPHSTIEEMASHYIEEIRGVQAQGPYFLGGHCYGGVIMYEMAQQLTRQGEQVAMMAMMDSSAPRINRSVTNMLGYAWKALRRNPGQLLAYFVQIEIPTRLRWFMIALAERLSGKVEPQDSVSIALRRVGAAISNAYQLYEPTTYPGRITYFMNSERARLPHEKWGELAGDGLDLHVFPGTPNTTFQPPSVEVLATQVGNSLRARQKSTLPDTIAG
jgi:surfactin family lipopeptide synthetase C